MANEINRMSQAMQALPQAVGAITDKMEEAIQDFTDGTLPAFEGSVAMRQAKAVVSYGSNLITGGYGLIDTIGQIARG